MNLVYGKIIDVFSEEGLPAARVRVGAALKRISTALIVGPTPGETVLVCDGVAIGKVENVRKESDVPGNTR
jgi:hydrogenase maturation factor